MEKFKQILSFIALLLLPLLSFAHEMELEVCSPDKKTGTLDEEKTKNIEGIRKRLVVDDQTKPFLSISLKSEAFHSDDPAKTRANVEEYFRKAGLKLDSYYDYDQILFVGFEETEEARKHGLFKSIQREFERDAAVKELKRLPYVQDVKLSHDPKKGLRVSVMFKKGQEPYDKQFREMKKIIGEDFDPKIVRSEDKAGSIWVSVSGDEAKAQMSKEELQKALDKFKQEQGDKLVSAELKFKLGVIEQ